ncbi:hypothetical protein [Salinarimonas ramus]|uniref:Uncharacterized protein n=1 Tax=Salinarimonas ramus TaxID=690164 RepID=A0A917QD05_9HYPH|nr:hypothetical protein [Salinarimonas ramus]GGK42006.1 hypothetical protein GCM10011322_31390 [Salinarimonas ramus]
MGAGASFNVFRRLDAPELRCAVPEDRAVPAFIEAKGWVFERRLDGGTPRPRGFDVRAADVVARWNGFYLFETWARDEAR